MNLDATIYGYEAENIVAIDGRTAFGKLIIEAFKVAVDYKNIVVDGRIQTSNLRLVELEFGGRTSLIISCNHSFFSSEFQELIKHIVSIENTIGNSLIEVAHLLIAHLSDDVEHDAVVLFNLTVAELALEHLFGKKAILYLSLFQSQTDL